MAAGSQTKVKERQRTYLRSIDGRRTMHTSDSAPCTQCIELSRVKGCPAEVQFSVVRMSSELGFRGKGFSSGIELSTRLITAMVWAGNG